MCWLLIPQEIIVDHKPYPAGLVKPKNGELYWIVDGEAAAQLPTETLRRMSVVPDK